MFDRIPLIFCSGHDDEVLDVCFDFTGQYIATASADGKQYPDRFAVKRFACSYALQSII